MKTDAELQQEAIRNIRNDVHLAGSQITVFVESGMLHLYGQVSAHYQKLIALNAIHRSADVRGVEDHLTVLPSLTDEFPLTNE